MFHSSKEDAGKILTYETQETWEETENGEDNQRVQVPGILRL